MISAIAVDDELPALKIIQHFCSKTDFIHLANVFNKPNEALAFANEHKPDLLFLDINMPSLTGLNLFRQLEAKAMVIFTTAYSDYALEGFNVDAIDYLLKPFTFDRFLQAVTKADELHRLRKGGGNDAENFLIVKADYSLVKIKIADILFIEGLDDYLKIHIAGGRPLVVRMTMKAMLHKLPPAQFLRVHRSYIVSLKNIESLRNKTIIIAGEEIPVSITYEQALLDHFNK